MAFSRTPSLILSSRDLAEIELSLCEDKGGFHRNYFSLLSACDVLVSERTEASAIAIAYVVYGWMPRMLRRVSFKRMSGAEIVKVANSAKNIDDASDLVRTIGRDSPINGSWVGMSKFLHFVNPRVFPIWDSRVAKNFGLETAYSLNKQDVYSRYLGYIYDARNSCAADKIQKAFYKNVGREPSKVRAIEYLLYRRNGDPEIASNPKRKAS